MNCPWCESEMDSATQFENLLKCQNKCFLDSFIYKGAFEAIHALKAKAFEEGKNSVQGESQIVARIEQLEAEHINKHNITQSCKANKENIARVDNILASFERDTNKRIEQLEKRLDAIEKPQQEKPSEYPITGAEVLRALADGKAIESKDGVRLKFDSNEMRFYEKESKGDPWTVTAIQTAGMVLDWRVVEDGK